MCDLIELKAVSGEQIAINPRGITALISHDGTTEVYLYGASEYFLVEGDYWTVSKKLNATTKTLDRNKGRWIDKGFAVVGNNQHKYECSECGHVELDYPTHYADGIAKVSNYCPNCGADMRGEQA